jgi:polyisoprenoid-binding protein YceI
MTATHPSFNRPTRFLGPAVGGVSPFLLRGAAAAGLALADPAWLRQPASGGKAPRRGRSGRVHWISGVSLLLFLLLLPSGTEAQSFQMDLARENQVTFISKAPLEDFQGVTHRMDGFVYLEGEGLEGATDLNASRFHFEVDLASLDTGIGLRNRHMRDRFLETDRFPFATFTGRVLSLEAVASRGFRATAAGDLSIHGVARRREIECGIDQEDDSPGRRGKNLRVRCSFTVALADHDIPIPRLLFMRISEEVELELDFHLVPAEGREG